MQSDRVVTDRSKRSVRQANLATLDVDTGAGRSLGDITGSDRAEELALSTCFRGNDQLELFQLLGALLSRCEVLARSLLELCTTCLEPLDVVRRGQRGLAVREQIVTAEAGLHFDPVTDVAEIGDLLEKNDFHLGAP